MEAAPTQTHTQTQTQIQTQRQTQTDTDISTNPHTNTYNVILIAHMLSAAYSIVGSHCLTLLATLSHIAGNIVAHL